jgi:hypothetical protein
MSAPIASSRPLHRDVVDGAFSRFRSLPADALIGALERRAGCATTYTCDRRAAETAAFSPVG